MGATRRTWSSLLWTRGTQHLTNNKHSTLQDGQTDIVFHFFYKLTLRKDVVLSPNPQSGGGDLSLLLFQSDFPTEKKRRTYPLPPPCSALLPTESQENFPIFPGRRKFLLSVDPSFRYMILVYDISKAPKALMKAILPSDEVNCFFAEFFRIEQSNWDVVLSIMQKILSILSRDSIRAVGEFHPLSKVTKALVHRSCRICFLCVCFHLVYRRKFEDFKTSAYTKYPQFLGKLLFF